VESINIAYTLASSACSTKWLFGLVVTLLTTVAAADDLIGRNGTASLATQNNFLARDHKWRRLQARRELTTCGRTTPFWGSNRRAA